MSLIKLRVKTNSQKYPIIIGNNILSKINKFLKKNSINFNQCLLVVDKNIPKNFIKSALKSLHNKDQKQFIILMLVKKIRIKKVSMKSHQFF